MVVTAESVQERGISAGMSETAAAHVETVVAVRREKRDRPEDGTNFESVHEYYKRTKDSRGGLNDGMGMVCPVTGWKLEALHGLARAASPVAPPVGVPGMVGGPLAVRPLAELSPVGATAGMGTPMVGGNLSFSTSNTENHWDEEEPDDDMGGRGKGISEGGAAAGAGSGKIMRFFEGLTKQAMERQEAMQHRFVEAIEKREKDRMIREEAWRRQRMAHEQEILAQERAMAATRGAAVLSFIQKITGQTIPMPYIAAPGITFMPSSSQTHATPIAYAAPPPPSSQPPACTWPQPSPRPPKMAPATPQPQPHHESLVLHQIPSLMTPAETPRYGSGGGGGRASSSSRWAKAEAHALIQMRSNLLDMWCREAGPKGPLWEEISAGMRRMGYSRSSKQCRQKWKNMNKYFNKVKQSNKKRREDSKTCSYFHHLEAFYRNKAALGSPSGGAVPPLGAEHANAAPQDRIESYTIAVPISQRAPQPHTLPPVAKYGVTNNDGNAHGVSGGTQLQASDGGSVARNRFVFSEAGGRAAAKKVITLERNVHSCVATGGTYMWYPAPIADDDIDLKPAPVAARAYDAAAKTNFEQQLPTGTTTGDGDESSMDHLNHSPELPVRSSTISARAQVEEFLKSFTDVVA